jgi:hypothetical protein
MSEADLFEQASSKHPRSPPPMANKNNMDVQEDHDEKEQAIPLRIKSKRIKLFGQQADDILKKPYPYPKRELPHYAYLCKDLIAAHYSRFKEEEKILLASTRTIERLSSDDSLKSIKPPVFKVSNLASTVLKQQAETASEKLAISLLKSFKETLISLKKQELEEFKTHFTWDKILSSLREQCWSRIISAPIAYIDEENGDLLNPICITLLSDCINDLFLRHEDAINTAFIKKTMQDEREAQRLAADKKDMEEVLQDDSETSKSAITKIVNELLKKHLGKSAKPILKSKAKDIPKSKAKPISKPKDKTKTPTKGPTKASPASKSPFTCKVCSKSFPSKEKGLAHYTSEHKLSCNICSTKFHSHETLIKHVKSIHKTAKPSSKNAKGTRLLKQNKPRGKQQPKN